MVVGQLVALLLCCGCFDLGLTGEVDGAWWYDESRRLDDYDDYDSSLDALQGLAERKPIYLPRELHASGEGEGEGEGEGAEMMTPAPPAAAPTPTFFQQARPESLFPESITLAPLASEMPDEGEGEGEEENGIAEERGEGEGEGQVIEIGEGEGEAKDVSPLEAWGWTKAVAKNICMGIMSPCEDNCGVVAMGLCCDGSTNVDGTITPPDFITTEVMWVGFANDPDVYVNNFSLREQMDPYGDVWRQVGDLTMYVAYEEAAGNCGLKGGNAPSLPSLISSDSYQSVEECISMCDFLTSCNAFGMSANGNWPQVCKFYSGHGYTGDGDSASVCHSKVNSTGQSVFTGSLYGDGSVYAAMSTVFQQDGRSELSEMPLYTLGMNGNSRPYDVCVGDLVDGNCSSEVTTVAGDFAYVLSGYYPASGAGIFKDYLVIRTHMVLKGGNTKNLTFRADGQYYDGIDELGARSPSWMSVHLACGGNAYYDFQSSANLYVLTDDELGIARRLQVSTGSAAPVIINIVPVPVNVASSVSLDNEIFIDHVINTSSVSASVSDPSAKILFVLQPTVSADEPPLTAAPTAMPTVTPTTEPTASPTAMPTAEPTVTPTSEPTATLTAAPTSMPTLDPTEEPTPEPTEPALLTTKVDVEFTMPGDYNESTVAGGLIGGILGNLSGGSEVSVNFEYTTTYLFLVPNVTTTDMCLEVMQDLKPNYSVSCVINHDITAICNSGNCTALPSGYSSHLAVMEVSVVTTSAAETATTKIDMMQMDIEEALWQKLQDAGVVDSDATNPEIMSLVLMVTPTTSVKAQVSIVVPANADVQVADVENEITNVVDDTLEKQGVNESITTDIEAVKEPGVIEKLCNARAACKAFIGAGATCEQTLFEICPNAVFPTSPPPSGKDTANILDGTTMPPNGDYGNRGVESGENGRRLAVHSSDDGDRGAVSGVYSGEHGENGEYHESGEYGSPSMPTAEPTESPTEKEGPWLKDVTLRQYCMAEGFLDSCEVPWVWTRSGDICSGHIPTNCIGLEECTAVAVGPCNDDREGKPVLGFFMAMYLDEMIFSWESEELGTASEMAMPARVTPPQNYLPVGYSNVVEDEQLYGEGVTYSLMQVIKGYPVGVEQQQMGGYMGVATSLLTSGASEDAEAKYGSIRLAGAPASETLSAYGSADVATICLTEPTENSTCPQTKTFYVGEYKYNVFGYTLPFADEGFGKYGDSPQEPNYEFTEAYGVIGLRMKYKFNYELVGNEQIEMSIEDQSGNYFSDLESLGDRDVKHIDYTIRKGTGTTGIYYGLRYDFTDTKYAYGVLGKPLPPLEFVSVGQKNVRVRIKPVPSERDAFLVEYLFDASDMVESPSWFAYQPHVLGSASADLAWVTNRFKYCSSMTCNELFWFDEILDFDMTGIALDGSIGIPGSCGGEVPIDGVASCDLYNDTTVEEAARICDEAGARLCTVAEVLALEGAGYCGVALDEAFVWTSTPCMLSAYERGIEVAKVGESWDKPERKCVEPTTSARAGKCCADTTCVDCGRCNGPNGGCMLFQPREGLSQCEEPVEKDLAGLADDGATPLWVVAGDPCAEFVENTIGVDFSSYCPNAMPCRQCPGGCILHNYPIPGIFPQTYGSVCSLAIEGSNYSELTCAAESINNSWCPPITTPIYFDFNVESDMTAREMAKNTTVVENFRKIGSKILFNTTDRSYQVYVTFYQSGRNETPLAAGAGRLLSAGARRLAKETITIDYKVPIDSQQALTLEQTQITDPIQIVQIFSSEAGVQLNQDEAADAVKKVQEAAEKQIEDGDFTLEPTPLPTEPTPTPTYSPSAEPTSTPTAAPTTSPTLSPTPSPPTQPPSPTLSPTPEPSPTPTPSPTAPTPSLAAPTLSPTEPTLAPTAPTPPPTLTSTLAPTAPTAAPKAPTIVPTLLPTAPTSVPTTPAPLPTLTTAPTPAQATPTPTSMPTAPSMAPTPLPPVTPAPPPSTPPPALTPTPPPTMSVTNPPTPEPTLPPTIPPTAAPEEEQDAASGVSLAKSAIVMVVLVMSS